MRGQVSLIDVLIFAFAITGALAVSIHFADSSSRAQVVATESQYAESMLLTTMSWTNESIGSWPNSLNMTLADALNVYFCNASISRSDMETAIGHVLNATVKPGYNYIFFASYTNQLWVWNAQADVCAKYISLVTFDFTPACNYSISYNPPTLGIWPAWKKLPPAAAC
ncbi:MAG: hypothetical protein KQA33_01495 [Candidatus Aenigmarchaeota archaeon]|nr:hypothetical protein [Candidatus Aenigmarchaeota archaeon]